MDKNDAVNPTHYADHAVAPIDLIASYGMADAFCRGNVIKYLSRAGEKNGREDDLKALWYLLYLLNVPQDRIKEITKEIKEIAV